MKKLLFITLICMLMLLPAAGAVTASTILNTEPAITIIGSTSAENIRPGGNVGYSVTLSNGGSLVATSVSYRISTDSGISGHSIGWTNLGNLPGSSSQVIHAPLKISEDAFIGIHSITVEVKYYGTQIYQTQTALSLDVEGETQLYLQDITFDTEKLEPGETSTIIAHIKNIGKSEVQKINAELTSDSEDIVPVLAGAEDYNERILPGGIETFDFQVSIDSSAETKTYSVTLTFDYEDEDGSSETKTFEIGLPISGTPLLEVLNTEVDNGEFKAEVENLGSAKAKAIRVELVQDEKVMDVDIDNELKPDKHTTFRFDTYKSGTGILQITYLDDDNNQHNDSIAVSIGSSSGNGGGSGLTIVLLIIVIAETYYMYRKGLLKFKRRK